MSSGNLTTKEVARILHVSEATVKRWAEAGVLTATKTVGGHRRFAIQGIARLRREQSLAGGNPRTVVESAGARKPLPSSHSLVNLLLHGAEDDVSAMIIDAYLNHHTLASLFDLTITEAMHEIGDLWFKGLITVADEHLATRTVISALQKLRQIVVPAEPTALKAICCGIEGDLHELPVHLAELIFESEGGEVMNLGGNTPLFALADMVLQQRPHTVCIAARTIADLDRGTLEYEQLRKITKRVNAIIVVGGEAFKAQSIRERFPAKFYGENFTGLAKFITRPVKNRI